MTLLRMAFAGALGTLTRYFLGQWVGPASGFPLGTFAVNLLGSLLIGFVASLADDAVILSPAWRLTLVTGFLGGFTTFSAFGYETWGLLRSGALGTALVYAGSSVAGSVVAVGVGVLLAHLIVR